MRCGCYLEHGGAWIFVTSPNVGLGLALGDRVRGGIFVVHGSWERSAITEPRVLGASSRTIYCLHSQSKKNGPHDRMPCKVNLFTPQFPAWTANCAALALSLAPLHTTFQHSTTLPFS